MEPEPILVVDDDGTVRDLLSEWLSDNGCAPRAAASAEEALEIATRQTFSLALVDLVLPGMSGLDLLVRLREISPDTVVVMMTSHASVETTVEAIRRGAYDYLTKPFDELDAVWLVVQRALERRTLSIRNRELVADLGRRNRELSVAVRRLSSLIDAGRAMSAIFNLGELLDYLLGLVVNELDANRASLMLCENGTLRIAAARGIPEEVVRNVRVAMGEGIAGRVAQLGKPILVRDAQTDPRTCGRADPTLAGSFISAPIVLSVPIKLREEVLGVINVTNRGKDRTFTKGDMEFLYGLAGQAAVAIEAAGRFERLRKAYESLKTAQEQLVASERLNALGQMAAGVAHDFNNLLAAILARTELLLRKLEKNPDTPADVLSGLRMLERSALQGGEAVRRIQDFAGVRRDRPDEPVDLNSVLTNALELTRPRWKDEAEAAGAVIDVEVETAERATVLGNALELTQAVGNLIFNSVEAMPQGGSITLRTGAEDGHAWAEVRDTGSGMTAEARSRVFEPFFTTKPAGHGLGLSVVHGIVTRHGGSISVESQVGVGTAFRLTLPIVGAVPAGILEGSSQKDDTVPAAAVLVVEDDGANRNLFREVLEERGHRVTCASTAEAALSVLREERFDLILTDLGLPGMSGLDLARRAKEEQLATRVVLASGWTVQKTRKEIEGAGVDAVLAKPCTIDQLIEAVDGALSQRAPQSGLREQSSIPQRSVGSGR